MKDGEVIIVDEFTGRLMPGRRWSDGLHQAVEAKEGVKIERENQTLATITFQNYFRMYKKLAGMTGTAETEAAEFEKIYKLEVTVIPTNRPMIRKENQDVVYRTEDEKFRNAAKEIKEFQERGQPVLVGTISVEKSERLAALLKKNGVRHEVLNAKNHEREAHIVAQAGRKGSVTVSTNMAGRGTDILLGGNPDAMARDVMRKQGKDPDREEFKADWERTLDEVKAACLVEHDEVVALGGLHIVGTERHDSRRIDNQLRGRAGRQGDPGSSRFFLSLQDDLLRIFGGERMQNLMLRLGMEEDVPIESNLITKRIAAAQKAVEAQNFESRKHLLEYDDVMNKQRQAVYGMRRQLLEGVDQKERVLEMTKGVVGGMVDKRCPDECASRQLRHDRAADRYAHAVRRAHQPGGSGRHERRSDRSRVVRAGEGGIPGEGRPGGRVPDARSGAQHHAPRHRRSVERPPALDGPPERGHRAARLRAERSAGRVQEGILHPVPGHDGPDRRRDGPLSLLPAVRAESRVRCRLPTTMRTTKKTRRPRNRRSIEVSKALEEQQRRAAQSAVQDMTRNIQKQHERELKELQFAGTNGSGTANQTVANGGPKVGRNDPCPCGSGKKYKKCHGA